MNNRQKIFWICPKWPWPMNDGAKVATCELLQSIDKSKFEIYLICLSEVNDFSLRKESDRQALMDRVNIHKYFEIPRNDLGSGVQKKLNLIWKLLKYYLTGKRIAVTLDNYSTKKIRTSLCEILDQHSNEASILVFDGLHGSAPFLVGDDRLSFSRFYKTIYRAHNFESELWKQSYIQSSGILKYIFLEQYKSVLSFEKNLSNKVDIIAPVSEEDGIEFGKISNKEISTVYIGMKFDETLTTWNSNVSEIDLLYVGKLDWLPNKEGLEWFLKSIWPKVIKERNDIFLNIVGSGNSDWLHPYLELKQIKFHGRVDSVEKYYQKCHCTLAPIFIGSGTRVKVIESMKFARLVIGTQLGVQGTGLTQANSEYIIENEIEWINKLTQLDVNELEKLGKWHFEIGFRNFDTRQVASVFEKLLLKVKNDN